MASANPRLSTQMLRLPQLDTSLIEQLNRFYGMGTCRIAGGRLLAWQQVGEFTPAGELHCSLADHRLQIAVDNLGALEPRLRGVEAFVPSEACSVLAEHALSPVLDLLEQMAGRSLQCEEFTRQPPRDADSLTLGFILTDLRGQQLEVRGRVSAPLALWRSMETSRAPKAASQRHLALPLRLALRLGRCRLPWPEVRDLTSGDALRFAPRAARPAPNTGLVIHAVHASGRLGFRARTSGHDLILDTSMSLYMDPNSTPRPANTPTPAVDLDAMASAVEAELSFELGTLQMTLAEMSRLRPGQALRLGVRLRDQPVRIMTSGRQIARGELATLGDEMVVVVTETGSLPLV
jgi:type III secretion system YscQ/HrcQ family protein